jgi:hypothetical protein
MRKGRRTGTGRSPPVADVGSARLHRGDAEVNRSPSIAGQPTSFYALSVGCLASRMTLPLRKTRTAAAGSASHRYGPAQQRLATIINRRRTAQ